MHHPIRIRALRLGLAACLLAGALAGLASANAPTYETTILFTHDTHDHFLPMPDEEGGEYGGYTRLATLIQQERAAHPDALVLDAGDFSMGSLFQTIYATEAPELRALGAMGYDATTLGNHEFDYRARGLAEMLNAAVESGDPVPPIVQANYKPPAEDVDNWAARESTRGVEPLRHRGLPDSGAGRRPLRYLRPDGRGGGQQRPHVGHGV